PPDRTPERSGTPHRRAPGRSPRPRAPARSPRRQRGAGRDRQGPEPLRHVGVVRVRGRAGARDLARHPRPRWTRECGTLTHSPTISRPPWMDLVLNPTHTSVASPPPPG